MSWKFSAGLPVTPGNQFAEEEMEVWNRLQTNSRRAFFRKGRYGHPPKRTMPRYDLVNRLVSELNWNKEKVYQIWWKMKSKCQDERRIIEGVEKIRK